MQRPQTGTKASSSEKLGAQVLLLEIVTTARVEQCSCADLCAFARDSMVQSTLPLVTGAIERLHHRQGAWRGVYLPRNQQQQYQSASDDHHGPRIAVHPTTRPEVIMAGTNRRSVASLA